MLPRHAARVDGSDRPHGKASHVKHVGSLSKVDLKDQMSISQAFTLPWGLTVAHQRYIETASDYVDNVESRPVGCGCCALIKLLLDKLRGVENHHCLIAYFQLKGNQQTSF